jgi:hypothetical protein
MNKEIREAISVALNANILKEDSLLTRYIGDTWESYTNLDEAITNFKEYIMKIDNPVLISLGEKIEYSATELKNNVTNAIK